MNSTATSPSYATAFTDNRRYKAMLTFPNRTKTEAYA